MKNEWISFLKQHGGKGYTMKELQKKYCQTQVSKKVAINMKEGKWSQKQAVAIAYNQVRKRSPVCGKTLKKK